ncbi:polyphosphate:nucleotide phosphotransferase, PPK2 family [Terriglobus roseus DSM 18391]|uniref:Polyphosphate:nucleotide phosphotransferase, PPK2 family n=1 Tax=Terriglobus roseus (strain DSM 18391 / NRRL B-41598 / KBS 63) TaxID=926566 RepID=I3ZKT5_TERRK|nr:polyphosphate kinase 2 family protein [Terriglobus roseus]AFL89853.1 polyphosphate:nucleotide phosphotransferase, PPK2 family [Terriglobus roseus DSM 18391]
MKVHSAHLIPPRTKVKLKHVSCDDTGKYTDEDAAKVDLAKHRDCIDKYQEVLYAGGERGVLIVLQGMDTAGKDGTIRHIFSGINPQGCDVTAFKVPTPLEAHHDFLWRCHNAVPARGKIGIFNRSHYEDVLSPRVHGLMKDKTAKQHMQQINDFESMLVDNGIAILKFFLHISPEEQKRRLESRIEDSSKHWKLSASDFAERKFWPDYQRYYEEIFTATSHKHAPWFVIPADNKWYRNVAISRVLAETMEGMKLEYPAVTVDVASLKL